MAFCADPCASPSTNSTSRPARARATASNTANVLLPTPPFVLPTVRIMPGRLRTGAMACQRESIAERYHATLTHCFTIAQPLYVCHCAPAKSPSPPPEFPALHDLIPLGPALPGALTTAEIDATMAYAEAEKALATRAAYASDWKDFSIWCASRGATALPAHVGIVAAYLSSLADSGRKASTIGRRAAAIGYHHKMAGHEPPTTRRPSRRSCAASGAPSARQGQGRRRRPRI